MSFKSVKKNKTKVHLLDYSFIIPSDFVEFPFIQDNSVKLVNSLNDNMLFVSVYARDGDYAKESFNIILNDTDDDVKLISYNQFKIENSFAYNIFCYKNEFYESIYLICKDNKTFKFTFILNSKSDSTRNLFKKIFKSIKKL